MQTYDEQISGYAHCNDPSCSGNSQQPVPVIRHTTNATYLDGGGDLPGIEKSWTAFSFADAEDEKCPFCSDRREVTDQRRPRYDPLSGHDPLALLDPRMKWRPGEAGNDQGAASVEQRAISAERRAVAAEERLERLEDLVSDLTSGSADPEEGTRPSDRKVPVAPNVYARRRADGSVGYQVSAKGVQSKTFDMPVGALDYREAQVAKGLLAPLPADFVLSPLPTGPAGLDGTPGAAAPGSSDVSAGPAEEAA